MSGTDACLAGHTAARLAEAGLDVVAEGEGPREVLSTAIGLAMSGLRVTAHLEATDLARVGDLLDRATTRHLPMVVQAAGAGAPERPASGGVWLFATNVQEAFDLTLAARRIAETALVPVVLRMDEAVASGVQDARLPGVEGTRAFLGQPGDEVAAPTGSQSMLFGDARRRVPRWHDLERPLMTGAAQGAEVRGVSAAGEAPFFTAHLPELVEQALTEVGRLTGRSCDALESFDTDDAEILLVAQGAAIETAAAVAAHLRATRKAKVGVVGVRCATPLPGGRMAELMRGRRAVLVLAPLVEPLRSCATRALSNGRFGRDTQPGYPAWHEADLPRIRAAALGPDGRPRVADLFALCESPEGAQDVQIGMRFNPAHSALPKRQALLDTMRRAYPELGARGLRADGSAPDVRPEGAVTVAMRHDGRGSVASEAAALLHAVRGGSVRSQPGRETDRFTWAPEGLGDPGDDGPVDLWVGDGANDPEALLGALMARLAPDARPRKVMAARAEMLPDDADLAAFEAGYTAGQIPEPATVATPGRSDSPAPLAVRHLGHAGSTLDSLPRFWGEVGVLYRDGDTAALVPDPYLTTGAVPPLSATFHDRAQARSELPAFEPGLCTGCGQCWASCPESAIGPLAISVAGLVEAGMVLAKAAGASPAPLRRVVSKLGSRTNKSLAKADQAPTTAAELLPEPFAAVADSMSLTSERRAEMDAAFEATLAQVGELPIARTEPFFHAAEREQPGSGTLLSLAVNADACQGCGLCTAVCEPEALAMAPQAELLDVTRAGWRRWERLPDTAGAIIERVAAQPDVGPLAALLLSRHCLLALPGGDRAEPGSGARLALRALLAAAEPQLQAALTAHASVVSTLRDRLDKSIREDMAEALPTSEALSARLEEIDRRDADLTAIVGEGDRVDVDRLRARVESARALTELADRIREGASGLGRARLGVALAPGGVADWAAVFPYNPFQVPVAVAAGGEAAGLARGLVTGQLEAAVAGFRTLRRAEVALEHPAEIPHVAESLSRLSWRDLDAEERRALPPLLLVGDDGLAARELAGISALLASDLPVKVVVLSSGGERDVDLALLAMAHRSAFVLQTSFAFPEHLTDGVAAALHFDGPALIRIHAPSPSRDGFEPTETMARAHESVASRRFPLLRFDPGADGVFGTRLNLAGNPEAAEAGAEPDAWRALQEVAGVVTPFTEQVRAEAERDLRATHEAALAEVRADYEARIASLRAETEAEMVGRVKERLIALAGHARDGAV